MFLIQAQKGLNMPWHVLHEKPDLESAIILRDTYRKTEYWENVVVVDSKTWIIQD